jgi:hypothetical protein
VITSDDFDLWRDSDVTIAVRKRFEKVEEEARNRWQQMLTTNADGPALAMMRVELAAKIQFVTEFRNLQIEDISDDNSK